MLTSALSDYADLARFDWLLEPVEFLLRGRAGSTRLAQFQQHAGQHRAQGAGVDPRLSVPLVGGDPAGHLAALVHRPLFLSSDNVMYVSNWSMVSSSVSRVDISFPFSLPNIAYLASYSTRLREGSIMERNEISQHEVKVYQALVRHPGQWLSSKDIESFVTDVSPRTIRHHLKKFVDVGVADLAELFPSHRYRWAERAEKRNKAYTLRLQKAAEAFDSYYNSTPRTS